MSCAEKNDKKDISILTETHINYNQIRHNQIHNWLGLIFFFPGDKEIKGLLVMLHPAVEGITDVDTDLKGGVCVL